MNFGFKTCIISLVLVVGQSSCLKIEELPDTPILKYRGFVVQGDTLGILQLSFQDGDGDVGLIPGDTTGPFQRDSLFYHNLFLDYFELESGSWVKQDVSVPFYYRIPKLDPVGQNPTLEGDIDVELVPFFDPTSPNDTFRFEAKLVDRSFQFSNTIVSATLIKP
ncbi:MAG: hypothetical protein ACJAY8_000753 [Sphingobacteriales bacterium]|jgi:hypothetical protein